MEPNGRINAIVPVVEGKPMAMAHLGRLLQADKQGERAVELCLRALQMRPDEILSNNMIGEGGLPVLEDAWRRLLTSAARLIPARGRVVVALAEDQMRDQRRMDVVAGFDLSTFNLAERPSYRLGVGAPQLTLPSTPQELFSFEFQSARSWPAGQASVALAAEGAGISGVAQWIALDLDAETTCENRPGAGARSCWAVMFHPFARPLVVAHRETIVVHGRHDRQGLHVWTSPMAGAGAPQ